MASIETALREPSTGVAPPDRARPTGEWSFTPVLRRLHFYVGVLVGPFLVVAALTGLAYALTPQLDQLAYGDQFRVAQIGAGTVPLSDQVGAARTIVPDGAVASVIPPAAPEAATQVVLSTDSPDGATRTVLIDPYNGEVHSVLPWSGRSPLVTWFRELHGNLHLGDPGALYIELAASWLWC